VRFVRTDTHVDYEGIFKKARKAGIDPETFDYHEEGRHSLRFPAGGL